MEVLNSSDVWYCGNLNTFWFCLTDVMIVAFPFILGQRRLDINEVHAGSTIASAQARPISTREKGGDLCRDPI